MELEFYNTEDGIHFPALGLWLDSRQSAGESEIVFVSHAHSDHISKHRKVVLSHATSRLMKERSRTKRVEEKLEFFKKREFIYGKNSYYLTLFPAGHILGSAMVLIEAFGVSILYTGDFKLSGSLTSEKCVPCHADYLIMETTFGMPAYRFPQVDNVARQIIDFCRATLSEKKTPILLCYSLGKSQDVLTILGRGNMPVMVHNQVYKMTAVYREFGYKFPGIEKLSVRKSKNKVVIIPPQVRNKITQLYVNKPISLAAITGWAIDSGAKYRLGVDAAFPLSNHSDFNELVEFVKIVNPRRVFTIHGFSSEFAVELNRLGYDAEPLEKSGQKWLPLTGWKG
ncbi:MAG: MBL fold metallo-hydrolase RNA specificity domain-containing protein [Verrucomicrobiia bacterium]